MKRFNKENIFQFIYVISSIVFLIYIPIIVIIKSSVKDYTYSEITDARTRFCFIFSIITFMVFIINMIVDRDKFKELLKKKTIFLFLGFLFWCYLSTSFSSNIKNSLYGIEYRYNGLFEYLTYISFACLGYSLNDKNRIFYFRIFTFIALIIGALCLYNVNINGILLPTNDISGIFYNINHYGYFISYSVIIVIFLFFHDKNIIMKILDYLVFAFFTYILIINNTFGAYIAVLGTLLLLSVYAVKKKVKIKYILLLLIFVILSVKAEYNGERVVTENFNQLLYDFKIINNERKYSQYELGDDNNYISYVGNYRGKLWIFAFKYSLRKPIVGYGLDNLSAQYEKDNIPIDTPHNLILNLAATVGYPGMLLYISGLIIIIIKGLKRIKINDHIKNLALFILIDHFISSMFGITIYYVTPYFIIILGMAIKLYDDELVMKNAHKKNRKLQFDKIKSI